MKGVVLVVVLVGCRAVFGLDPPIVGLDSRADDAVVPSDGNCPPGYELIGDACVDLDECALATDDCSANATCANEAGSFTCTCAPGFAGDGRTCTRICTTALLYIDCPDAGSSCAGINHSTYVTNAIIGRGLTVQNGGDGDQPAFRSLFDAGNFDLLIVDSARATLDNATVSRIATWVGMDRRAIVTYWDLNNNQTLMTALAVDASGNYTNPRDVYLDPNATVNLFGRVEQLTSPLTFNNLMADDGDVLTLVSTGRIVARHQSPSGTGAIAITRADHAITLGFLPVEQEQDADNDGKPDATELYANMIAFLCGY